MATKRRRKTDPGGHALSMRAIIPALAFFMVLAPGPVRADASSDLEAKIKELLSYVPFKAPALSSAQEIALGRELFFDPRLSKTNLMSCATCHIPARHWADGRPRAKGSSGEDLPRNTPSVLTARYNQSFFWDGKTSKIEETSLFAMQNPKEMNETLQSVAAKLSGSRIYSEQFASVYGSPTITPARIGKALAAFMVSLAVGDENSFDRFLKDRTGLSAAAQAGFLVFAGKGGCLTCHEGINFTNGFFHNIGLKKTSPPDLGRYALDSQPDNWGAFRTPSLRDVALTAPYMHDGSLKTLSEVVDFYDRGGDDPEFQDVQVRALHLSSQEKQDLVAFLESLTRLQLPPADPPKLPALDVGPAGPATGSPSPVADSAVIERLSDQVLEEASERTADLRRFLTRFPAGGAAAPLSIDAAEARDYCLHGPGVLGKLPKMSVVHYLVCRAREKKDPHVCDEMGPPSQTMVNDVQSCQHAYWDISLAEKIISRDPGAIDVCMKDLSVTKTLGNLDERRELCGLWVQKRDAEGSCVEFAARLTDQPHLQKQYLDGCLKTASLSADIRRFSAVQKDCGQFKPEETQSEICPDMRAFRAARESGRPSACGAAPLCRLMLGDSSACENYLSAQIQAYCKPRFGEASSSASAPEKDPLVSEIEAALREIQGRPLTAKAAAAAKRLDALMEGRTPFEPKDALADVQILKFERLETLLSRAQTLVDSLERRPGRAERQKRLEALRSTVKDSGAAWAKGRKGKGR